MQIQASESLVTCGSSWQSLHATSPDCTAVYWDLCSGQRCVAYCPADVLTRKRIVLPGIYPHPRLATQEDCMYPRIRWVVCSVAKQDVCCVHWGLIPGRYRQLIPGSSSATGIRFTGYLQPSACVSYTGYFHWCNSRGGFKPLCNLYPTAQNDEVILTEQMCFGL